MDGIDIFLLVFLLLLLAGGPVYYFFFFRKEGEKCELEKDSDKFANYKYNDKKECVFSECKTGYKIVNGKCVKQNQNNSSDDSSGDSPGASKGNCKITKYKEGACVNDKGIQLDGTPGRCGKGIKRFTADTEDGFELAGTFGECENFSYTENCTVDCKSPKCSADDSNYTKTDDICYSNGGEPLTGNKCGSGYKIFEVNPATAGNFSSDKLKNDWIKANWADCTPLKKACTIPCETGMERVECPELSGDIETSYVVDKNGEKACLEKNTAIALLKGTTRYDNVSMPMEKLTRANAKLKGITRMEDLPDGYSIKFKSGLADFTNYSVLGCDVAQLEPCKQPTVPDDCIKDDVVTSICYDVGCGLPKKKKVKKIITNEAWGSGGCDKSDIEVEREVECSEESTPACCNTGNDTHWRDPVAYTCSSTSGTYNLVPTGCSNFGVTNPPVKTKPCCYVGDWVKGQCNQDNQLNRVKWTRTVHNPSLCTDEQLNKGVYFANPSRQWESDVFDKNNPTVKYVRDTDSCNTPCQVKYMGHTGPVEQMTCSGCPGCHRENCGCRAQLTYKLTTKGRGSQDNFCTQFNNLNVGQTLTISGKIPGSTNC